MDFPVFSKNDLGFAIEDGNFPISSFIDFLKQLKSMVRLNHPSEEGVVSYVIQNGTESLSPKQVKVLKLIISRYGEGDCSRCGNQLEWNELFEAQENGGYCGYCANELSKISEE